MLTRFLVLSLSCKRINVDLLVDVVNSCCFVAFVSTICILKRFIFKAVTRKFHATFYIYSSDLCDEQSFSSLEMFGYSNLKVLEFNFVFLSYRLNINDITYTVH